MTDKVVSFVTTTIHEPMFVEGYLQNLAAHNHSGDDVGFVVIGDLKTPLGVEEYSNSLAEEYGIPVEYLNVDDQLRLLDKWGVPELDQYISYNSIQRRNVGYLYATRNGADVIVSLDDDNLARDSDIADKFADVGETHSILEVSSPNNWYNPASMLQFESDDSHDIYHRGFPYSRRDASADYTFKRTERTVMARAGLWFDVPDVDVITHLERAPIATGLRDEFEGELVGLGEQTFAPVNTQNTAFHTDLMPFIHTIPMGQEVKGMEVSRFDDIWLGFFLEKALHEMGGTVAYGDPISTHDRNTHQLKRELEHEAIGIRLNEVVVDTLENIDISGSTYHECYTSLIDEFRAEIDGSIEYEFEAYFNGMLDGMETWTNVCERVLE